MMEKPAAPWPLLQAAIEPKSKADQEKLLVALSKLAADDPWLQVKWDEESGQTIIAFMGDVELDGIIERVRRKFMINVNVGAPQIAYRETITRGHQQDYTHKRIFGGKDQFARVKIVFEPDADSTDFVFESRIVGEALPNEYIAGVEKGLRNAVSAGPFAGFPMIGVKTTLVNGALHDTDSSALAFEIAGRACFREAAPRLGVQLLEPIMKVEVVTPAEYVGSIIGELNSRRGQIRAQEIGDAAVVIDAVVPLATMFTLEETLRSRSKGQARLSAFYAGYAPVPLPPNDRDPPAAMAIA